MVILGQPKTKWIYGVRIYFIVFYCSTVWCKHCDVFKGSSTGAKQTKSLVVLKLDIVAMVILSHPITKCICGFSIYFKVFFQYSEEKG